MKTKEEIKQFILETLLPYKEDPTTCGFEGGCCLYKTSDGRKCAFGKHMREGVWQDVEGNADCILDCYGCNNVLTEEALSFKFSYDVWNTIQNIHDHIALELDAVVAVMNLEKALCINLNELK